MLMIESILIGFVCGAWSFMWCEVLTRPGMIGNFVPVLYWRIVGKHTTQKEWIAKPLFYCAVCNSFWIALGTNLINDATLLYQVGTLIASLFSAYYLTLKYGN